MKRLVPNDKFDDEACHNLAVASDSEIAPHIESLLKCLQDINWPIAVPVSERLSTLGLELVTPITNVLSGKDEIWKYWIVSHLLHNVRDEVYQALYFKLKSMRKYPTAEEREEEVYDAICDLLSSRKMA